MSATTEARHAEGMGLDAMAPEAALSTLFSRQQAAVEVVKSALSDLDKAADLAAQCVARGGRLVYAGAGSSGLMALSDGLELPGTFGYGDGEISILIAGGSDSLEHLVGTFEDRTDLAHSDLSALSIGETDCVLCISASGSTPYTVEIAKIAKAAGASVIGVANNAGTLLLENCDVAILLETPPEVIAGSTRMGAGTAQKIALNLFSTAMAIKLGHVYDGYMVGLKADNAKLRERAREIVVAISGARPEQADTYLNQTNGSVKLAVLLAAGVSTVERAARMLSDCNQNLRSALALTRTGT
jgi:N-acetylmuramic acid 6-phosphate etherase